jgi:YgiT-type zinc finger domain-containing protein
VGEPHNNSTKTVLCDSCGGVTEAKEISVTMQTDDGGLVLIEKVPARVCNNCQEQYYDEVTSQKIIKLANNGFPKRHVVREIAVPVISLEEVRIENAGERAQERQEN